MAAKKKYFSIGEVSKLKGVSRKALRFYEKIGLLRPEYVDPANAYRYYSREQFVHIDIIKALRVMDISPIAIRTVLEKRDTETLLEFLEAEKTNALRKVDELTKTVACIEEVRNSIRISQTSMSHKGVYRREIPRRLVVTLPFEGIADAADAAIAYSRLDSIIGTRGLSNAFETGILFEKTDAGFIPDRIYNAVLDREGSDTPDVSIIPDGEYVCIWYTENNAEKRGLEITAYCERHGLTPHRVIQADLLSDVFETKTPAVELQLLVSPP